MIYLATALICLFPAAAFGSELGSAGEKGFDWEILLKTLGFVVSIILAYIQVRGYYLNSRGSLKTDLEILNLLEATDPNYQSVKNAVDWRIAYFYYPFKKLPRLDTITYQALFWFNTRHRVMFIGMGLFVACGGFYGTFKLAQPSFSWWAILPGFYTLYGIYLIFGGIRGRIPFFVLPQIIKIIELQESVDGKYSASRRG